MKSYIFRAVIEEDPFEDGRMAYRAYVPILEEKGASTFGYTKEEALENLQEVLNMLIKSMIEYNESILEELEEVEVREEPLVTVTVP